MKSNIQVKVNGKLNLSLSITGIQDDGFHCIDTLMQSVSICDDLCLEMRKDKKNTVHMKNIHIDSNNSAIRAANLFCTTFGTNGVDIAIEKGIPLGGGMGGSSANAAATLVGMSQLYEIPLDECRPLASSLGSDTPFMFNGGLARATGTGQVLEFFQHKNKLSFCVIFFGKPIQTEKVYKLFDTNPDFTPAETDIILDSILKGDVETIRANMFNALQQPAAEKYTQISRIVESLNEISKFMLTGSGSSLFTICDNESHCRDITRRVKALGFDARECVSCEKGMEVM